MMYFLLACLQVASCLRRAMQPTFLQGPVAPLLTPTGAEATGLTHDRAPDAELQLTRHGLRQRRKGCCWGGGFNKVRFNHPALRNVGPQGVRGARGVRGGCPSPGGGRDTGPCPPSVAKPPLPLKTGRFRGYNSEWWKQTRARHIKLKQIFKIES